jgi:hypothetical protein
MKIHDCEQYSDAWYEVRKGIPTASQFHNIITPLGAPTRGDRRKKYMYRLIAERLLGQSMDDRFENYWTKRGHELEDPAAEAFFAKFRTKLKIKKPLDKVGFVTTDDGRIGASPERLFNNGRRGLEIKCPSPWVQIEYLLDGPGENYAPQVQGHIMVCELKEMHLWCWHPNMPPVDVETARDEEFIEKLAKELWHFCNELDAETDRARRKGPYVLAKLLKLSAEIADDIPGTFPWLQ